MSAKIYKFPTVAITVPELAEIIKAGQEAVSTPTPTEIPTVANGITVFEVNRVYHVRSIGDNNCIWNYRVISRTAKRITLQELGETKQITCGIKVYDNCEQCKPHGSYSMCAILTAEKVGEKRPDYSR